MRKFHPGGIIFFIYFMFQANPILSILDAYNEVRDCHISCPSVFASDTLFNNNNNNVFYFQLDADSLYQ